MTCKGHREVVVHLRLCNRDSVRSASTLLLRARTMLCCLASRGILPQATPSQNRPCPVSEMRSTWLESRGRSHGSALTCSSVCLASLVSRQTRVPVSVFLLLQWQCACWPRIVVWYFRRYFWHKCDMAQGKEKEYVFSWCEFEGV